jgi:hypothetical protein
MSRITEVSVLNKIKDPNRIFPDQEIYLPFKCEQETDKYVLIDRGKDRLINPKYLIKVKTKILSDGRRVTFMQLPNGKIVNYDISLLSSSDHTSLRRRRFSHENKKVQVSVGTNNTKPTSPPFKKYNSLSFSGLYGFNRIDSVGLNNGSTALLLSKPIIGLHLGWDLHWTPRLTTNFNFVHRQIEMERATTGLLINQKQNTSGLGADIRYRWTDQLKSVLGFNYEDRLFVRSIQIGTASLEVYQQPSMDLKIEHQVFHYGSFGMDVMLGYRQMFKTSAESASIYNNGEYLMGAAFRRQMKKMQIELQLNYLKGQLKSDITEQDNTGIEARIGFNMEIGK